MDKMLFYVVLLSLTDLCLAQYVQDGQCDSNTPVQANFDVQQFLGTWYEVSRIPNTLLGGDCSRFEFEDDNATLTFTSESVNANFRSDYAGNFSVGSTTGQLSLDPSGSSALDFWIITTDYLAYALAYNCENVGTTQRSITIWKLGRQTTIASELVQAFLNTQISNLFGINATETMVDSNHSEDACYVLPDIEEGLPVILPGICDTNITGVANFDASRFLGRWYELSSYASESTQGSCPSALYSLNDDGTVGVVNSEVLNQTQLSISGYAVVSSNDGSGVLSVSLEVIPGVFVEQELKILETDYENYAISYSCVNINNTDRRVFSWILSRTKDLSEESTQEVNAFVDSILDLNYRYYIEADQSEDACFYFPEPTSNQPVIFPGSCDLSIPVVTNFSASDYLGLWHEISSYPSMFQTGTCNNADYSLLDFGAVNVYNTQVINETLDVATGVASLIGDDGSARLVVTFEIDGVFNLELSSNYWVLATDYLDYALVYSCQNLPDYQRAVWSWKLSRSKQLSPTAQTAINNVVSTIQVLDERYYQDSDQTREGCFYYPEPVPGQVVIFPGQCDENITAQANFNYNSFAGIWHEIEAYPKSEQPGQCISHDFIVTNNGFDLESFQIVDQFLNVKDAIIQPSVTDGSGKFTVTFDSDGVSVTIPYWILSTDYENYALAYSCVNIDEDYRAISSMKLSREQSLNQASQTALNNAMADIDVLGNQYFELIDQTEEACFFLPDLEDGEAVVLVGQCDPNIPAMTNFDPELYQGTWQLIESYPSDFQSGDCQEATYTLDGSTVIVYNTQVINETLDEVTGSAVSSTTDGSGKLLVTFPIAGTNLTQEIEYWVLASDYTNYALVYSCINLSNSTRRVWSWKMSRSRSLSNAANVAINEVIDSVNVLNNRFYQTIAHNDDVCFYYPDHVPDMPVVFRGPCNMDIPVISNFDVEQYLGTWYEIESYPSPYQQGTCGRTDYTLENNQINIVNTQVLNQNLNATEGVVSVSSDGYLIVSLPSIDNPSETISATYWILDTDYENYALIYSCSDIEEIGYSSVSTWKLSRTRALSATSISSINNVTSTVRVLDQRYYQDIDQSDSGCFYYPEPGTDPVVFPGQCDDTIQAMPNFDLSSFEGIWHEVSSYPKLEQQGDCLNYNFSLSSNNSFALTSNAVLGLNLTIAESTVNLASVDESGRFSITMISNGEVITIPYWIIDTDYTSYALAYSCVDQTSETRGVWSWKLSRNQTLSASADASIDLAMANIDVLDNRFFIDVDQSDDACFYLPDIGLTEPAIFVGQCDENIAVVQNFDPTRYQGQWYDVASYYDAFQDGTCNDALYTLTPEGVVDVYNTQVIGQELDTINGTAVLATTDGSGKLLVTFPIAGTDFTVTSQYWVLDTDYDNYSLVYSCSNLDDNRRRVYSWKLSRTRSLLNESSAAIDEVMENVPVLNERYFITRDHSEDSCFYYPEPVVNQPVTFRGQCDDDIAVVQNFDAVAYSGLWYDVGSYPQEFQDGTCPTALYTINSAGTVDVYNTQVINQQLDTINGTASVVSTDGSAKLSVLFPIGDFTVASPYWVLSTDYDNYALVYACVNLGPERYRVSSWKLGRQPNLSNSSETIINEVMDSIRVLDDRYYVERTHTEDDCFFYPDNFGGPVILDGQCDPNQSVVTNFDTTQFSGTWYETARFPSDVQTGECGTTSFDINSTSILTHTLVYEELLTERIGFLDFAADGSGIFSAAFNGDSYSMTYYVLDTDYTNYALMFSCADVSNNTKQIFSWKLSRSRDGLSQQANENINAIVSSNVDLFEGYYEETDLSDSACFYYPMFFDPTAPIILPGPCNETITAQADFSVADYLGRWFETSRYPQPFEEGECARATYTLGSDGVDVTNEIVFNRTLEVVIGNAVVASTDGSGLLSVTFVVNGITNVANYYVLSTDYDNYALVYSCRNLDNGDRQVSSWKLSRQPSLDPQYNAIIDPIVVSTQGLLEDYYSPTSQSDEDCFYIPELVPNQDVVFRGQCADVSGVQGFNVENFLGWWHEIESYPQTRDTGDCRSSQLQSSGNQFLAVDTDVNGLSATVVTSTLIATTDGRLIRTNSDGSTTEIVVLATDYDNYALLYSCENINSEYRRVWSAKHSKTRQLTTTAEAAMSPFIASNEVLINDFYLPVDQSDVACFHYPEQAGQQVIIPGQCDEGIPVQQNFDAVQYTGTWYQIEKYPQVFESGSCVGARYTLDEESGLVSVLNWEVLADGVLATIEGNATISSIDGSGRLIVNLPIVGTELMTSTELYILTTDYVSYSLAYSCENVNEYQRSVGAWKLSRTRSLPSAGNTAINAFINQRDELYQPYFVATVQNEDCDEPSSSVLVKSSILVVLACAIFNLLS